MICHKILLFDTCFYFWLIQAMELLIWKNVITILQKSKLKRHQKYETTINKK